MFKPGKINYHLVGDLEEALDKHREDLAKQQKKLTDKLRVHQNALRSLVDTNLKDERLPADRTLLACMRSEASCIASILEDLEISALGAQGRWDASEREVKAAARRLREGKGWAEYVAQGDLRFYGDPGPEEMEGEDGFFSLELSNIRAMRDLVAGLPSTCFNSPETKGVILEALDETIRDTRRATGD